MKRIMMCLLALVLAVMSCGSALAASVVQPGEDFYYLDTANVLSRETEGEIFFCNQLLEKACGAQIVIAAVDSIGSRDIYDYAVEMGNSWGIGSSQENNGFLLLMTIEEDNYYAVTGRGLDGIFPASVLKQLYDDHLEADFAAKNYDAGARKFFESVFIRIADYYNADVSVQDGIAAYEAYAASNTDTASFGGARGGAYAQHPAPVWEYHEVYDEPGFFDIIGSFFSSVISIIVLIVVLSILFGGRRRGGMFFMPLFFGGRRHYHHHHHNPRPRGPHHGPGAPVHRPPRSFGGFGGGAGRGGFGGGRGGGGGGFGGGAGRGRH